MKILVIHRLLLRRLGTQAAQGIIRHAFQGPGLSRLIFLIDGENAASRKVAARIGMTFEREWRDDKGPFLIYSMSKEPDASTG